MEEGPRYSALTIPSSAHGAYYGEDGPFLTNHWGRLATALNGKIKNYEIVGDGGELDFFRVCSTSRAILFVDGAPLELEAAAETEFRYKLTLTEVVYSLPGLGLEVHKRIFPLSPSDSPAFGIRWEVHNLGAQHRAIHFLSLYKFTLGDPYYTYAEFRRGFTVINRVQPKYRGSLWNVAGDTQCLSIWCREDTLTAQISTGRPFSETLISTKPSEDSWIGYQYALELSEAAVKTLDEALAGGQNALEARKFARQIAQFSDASPLSMHLDGLTAKMGEYMSVATGHSWLDAYVAVCARTVDQIYFVQHRPYVVPGHQYPRFYARDSYWQILGLLYLGRFVDVKNLILHYFSAQNGDGSFPTSLNLDGTKNQFSPSAPDLDSCLFPILSLIAYLEHTGDRDLVDQLYPKVISAMDYIRARDIDGDGWLEQGENQDWADTMYREGNIAYCQAVYYRALLGVAAMAQQRHDGPLARDCGQKAAFIRENFDRKFWDTAHQTYADHIKSEGSIVPDVSQDVCLAISFGLAAPDHARIFLNKLKDECWTDWGATKQTPYANSAKFGPPGFYHNGGVWLWSAAFEAHARFSVGQTADALWVLKKCYAYDFGQNPYGCVYMNPTEWFGGANGLNQYHDYKQAKNFATGAGALMWAVLEGYLGGPQNAGTQNQLCPQAGHGLQSKTGAEE